MNHPGKIGDKAANAEPQGLSFQYQPPKLGKRLVWWQRCHRRGMHDRRLPDNHVAVLKTVHGQCQGAVSDEENLA